MNGHTESIVTGGVLFLVSSVLLWLGLMPWQATVGVWLACLLLMMPNRTRQAGDTLLGWYRAFRFKDPTNPPPNG